MPFIAECQFCHAKMRVPDESAGKSISCPRCGDWFTLAPMEQQPDVPAAPARSKAAAAAAAVLAAVDAEDQPEPEGSPTQTGKPRAVRQPDPEPWRRPWAFPYELFGGGALVLAGAAMAFAALPGWQMQALVLAASAIALGATGFIVASKPDRGGRVRPVLGTALGAAVLVVSLVWPGFLGGGPPFGDNTPRPLGRNAPIPGGEQLTEDTDTGGSGKTVHQLGTLQVRVVTAESVPVKYINAPPPGAPDRLLQVTVRVYNGSTERPVTYYSWSRPLPGEKSCTTVLRDDGGKEYTLAKFGTPRSTTAPEHGAPVAPGGRVEEVLTFEVPASVKSSFELQLPLAAIGGTGMLPLSIPANTIVGR